MARGKLQNALDRHQGRNLDLEKQRKQEKSAKKRSKNQQNCESLDIVSVDKLDGGEDVLPIEEEEALDMADGLEVESELDDGAEGPEAEDDASEVSDSSGGIPLSDIESLGSEDKADVIPFQRLTINNVAALQKAHRSMLLPKTTDFSLRQVVTAAQQTDIPDVHDDLNRELAFYKQCLEAAVEGRSLLKKQGVPFTRPNDFFAEMVKTDEHMGKIKAKMIQAESDKKAAAEARKLRDLKKFGKKVQVARLQERDRERKQTLDKIGQLKRKRRDGNEAGEREDDLFDIALDDATSKPGDGRPNAGARKTGQSNDKRQKKDAKFGFGGKKRYSKSSDAVSSGDLGQFSAKRMKTQAKGPKRLGKSRRANATR